MFWFHEVVYIFRVSVRVGWHTVGWHMGIGHWLLQLIWVMSSQWHVWALHQISPYWSIILSVCNCDDWRLGGGCAVRVLFLVVIVVVVVVVTDCCFGSFVNFRGGSKMAHEDVEWDKDS